MTTIHEDLAMLRSCIQDIAQTLKGIIQAELVPELAAGDLNRAELSIDPMLAVLDRIEKAAIAGGSSSGLEPESGGTLGLSANSNDKPTTD
jgi:hypothetical protein